MNSNNIYVCISIFEFGKFFGFMSDQIKNMSDQ